MGTKSAVANSFLEYVGSMLAIASVTGSLLYVVEERKTVGLNAESAYAYIT